MLRLSAIVVLVVLMIGHAFAGSKISGQFDYYILSLNWSPSWCATTGDAQGADECDGTKPRGFSLHGLWPQFEKGWPSFCNTSVNPPEPGIFDAMGDLMGSAASARHQWDKHGRCSGLPPQQYFSSARAAYNTVQRPKIFRDLLRPITLPAHAVKTAFLKSNPTLSASMISVRCTRGYFSEIRICLDKNLNPRACGLDVRRDCTGRVIFPPMR